MTWRLIQLVSIPAPSIILRLARGKVTRGTNPHAHATRVAAAVVVTEVAAGAAPVIAADLRALPALVTTTAIVFSGATCNLILELANGPPARS